jgi:hypothetical protein
MRHEEEHECEQFVQRITRNFLELARTRQQTVICVSNEVGLGVVPETSLGRVFRDLLGRANQDFAAAADEVISACRRNTFATEANCVKRCSLRSQINTDEQPISFITQVCRRFEPVDQAWLSSSPERQLTLTNRRAAWDASKRSLTDWPRFNGPPLPSSRRSESMSSRRSRQ